MGTTALTSSLLPAFFQLPGFFFHSLGQLFFVRVELLCNARVGDSDNLCGQDAGVRRSGLSDCDCRDGNSRGHLHS